MKYLLPLVCLVLAGCISHSQTGGQQAIANVLAQKESAGRKYARIVLDGDKIMSVHLHGMDYLAAIKKIDASGCPVSFQSAWAGYCAAWEQKLRAEKADEDTLDLISMWKGEIGDLQATYDHLEAYDTEPAWQRCVQTAAAADVPSAAPASSL